MFEKEINKLFLEGFISELDEHPEHYEDVYGVPIEKIKENPEYYYNLDMCDEVEEVETFEDLPDPKTVKKNTVIRVKPKKKKQKSKKPDVKISSSGTGFLL